MFISFLKRHLFIITIDDWIWTRLVVLQGEGLLCLKYTIKGIRNREIYHIKKIAKDSVYRFNKTYLVCLYGNGGYSYFILDER